MKLLPAPGAAATYFDRFDVLSSRWDPFPTAYDAERDIVLDPAGPAYSAVVQTNTHHHWAEHTHRWHELIWPLKGNIRVIAGSGVIPVAHGTGVWISAGEQHEMYASEGAIVGFRWLAELPAPADTRIGVIRIPAVLQQTLLYLNSTVMEPEERERALDFAQDILRRSYRDSLRLPVISIPQTEPLRTLCTFLSADPGDERTIEEWGRLLHVSARTLSRLFQTELGMSFTQWRTHARVATATTLLSSGTSVSATSHQVGYSNVSAFTAVFRRLTGSTPGMHAHMLSHEI